MGDISQRIDDIIAARRQRLAVVVKALENIKKSEEIVNGFKTARNNLDPEKAGMKEDAIDRIYGISFLEYNKILADTKEELERLRIRFAREMINISFVGRAGQGKSLVLQKISGLGGTVIPSAAGTDCTGAKSIITNDETAQKPYANITFFTEAEMTEIINVYLEKIFGDSSQNIHSLNEAWHLRRLLQEGRIDLKNNTIGGELLKYIENLDAFRPLLGQSTRRVEEEDIEEYVAMFKSSDHSVKYYKFLGVKRADIHCAFPKRDAGKIILVDTIGMGSQSLGVRESLMETVKNDSDAVIYMKRPEAQRDHWGTEDTDITNGIVDAIGENCAKMTLFCVLNAVSSGAASNQMTLEAVKNQIMLDYKGSYFADVLKVDCASEEQVEDNLLTPVLEAISHNISKIDEIYLKDAAVMLEALYRAYHAICGQVEMARVSDTFARHCRYLISGTIKAGLQGKIRDLYMYQYNHVEEASESMMSKVEEILKDLPSTLLSKKEIIDYLRNNKQQHEAYMHAMNVMRVRIINAFLTLDVVLSKETDEAKVKVIEIMTDPLQGALGNAFPYAHDTGPSEWINDFIAKNHGQEGFAVLEPAFKALERYSLKVEGFLLHEIRLSLAQIDPSLQGKLNELPAMSANAYDEIADCIVDYLKDALFDLRQTIRKKMARYYKIVSQANFAAIWDFYDRISYSASGDEDAVYEAWEALYERWCEDIWPFEAIKYNDTRNGALQWNNAVEQLKAFDEERNFGMR